MVHYEVRIHGGDPNRVALILPGSGYTAQGSLLSYAGQALRAAGWSTKTLVWDGEPDGLSEAGAGYRDLVRELATATSGTRHLIVGKSLGTLVLPLALELSIPGAWLTPLISEHGVPEVRDAALGLTGSGIPALLVGGTADRLWDSQVASRSGAHVIEVPDANHSLEVPGDWQRSLAILGKVTEAVADLAAEAERDSPLAPRTR
jgi:hypothetical protein